MICLICRQEEIGEGTTSVKFQRGKMHLQIQNVPACICPGCGEAYVEDAVAVQLLQTARAIYGSGQVDVVTEYRAEHI
jgi:YgiT-type zinc finger domain-containing protein